MRRSLPASCAVQGCTNVAGGRMPGATLTRHWHVLCGGFVPRAGHPVPVLVRGCAGAIFAWQDRDVRHDRLDPVAPVHHVFKIIEHGDQASL